MDTSLFQKYRKVMENSTYATWGDTSHPDEDLLIDRDGPVSIHYAPFDFINTSARVVVIGITPGRTQMLNALREASKQLANGASVEAACQAVKKAASFSGAMRPNLINLLDHVGINRWLGLQSTSELFAKASNLVQTTSVLRYPVFVGGQNYNGSPDMTKHPLLQRHLADYFGREAKQLDQAVFVPLGDKVAQALRYLAKRGYINETRILDGMPHPSGANAERIAYFLGAKTKGSLSIKTDPVKIEVMRAKLKEKVLALGPALG